MGQGPRQRPRWREVAPGRFDLGPCHDRHGRRGDHARPAASAHGTGDRERMRRGKGERRTHASVGGEWAACGTKRSPEQPAATIRTDGDGDGQRCGSTEGEAEGGDVQEGEGLTLNHEAWSARRGDDRRRRIGPAELGRVRTVLRTPVSIPPVPTRFQAPGGRGGCGEDVGRLRSTRGGPGRRRCGG